MKSTVVLQQCQSPLIVDPQLLSTKHILFALVITSTMCMPRDCSFLQLPRAQCSTAQRPAPGAQRPKQAAGAHPIQGFQLDTTDDRGMSAIIWSMFRWTWAESRLTFARFSSYPLRESLKTRPVSRHMSSRPSRPLPQPPGPTARRRVFVPRDCRFAAYPPPRPVHYLLRRVCQPL